MQHKIEKCKIHQEQAIALEYRSDKDQHYQMMCENCLIERFNDRNILSLKDADKLKEKLLNQNQSMQKGQIDEKINSLTRMNMIVRQLSENYTSFFDQIIRQINEWIKSIGQRNQETSNKENQLNTKFYDNLFGLKQFGIGTFGKIYKFEENNSISQYQYEILQEMMKLQQSDLFDQCLDSIVTYSEENELLQMTDKNQSSQNQTSKKTPNLDLICKDHEKEIILFDLNEQSEKEKRAKCIECDPCLFTSLSKFQILWKQFEKQQYDIISQFHISRKTQIGLVKNQLYALKSNLIEKINQVLLQLNEFMFSSEREVEKFIEDMGKNWSNLTFAEVLERAEIISKPNLQKKQLKDLEIKYKMKNWYIDSLMKTNLDELSQIQFSFNNLLQGIQENLVQEDGIIITTLNGFQSTIGSDQKKNRSNSVSSEKKKISLKEQRTDQKIKKAHNKHKSLEESQIMQFRLSDKLVSYQLIFSKKQTEWCNAMALNSQGNVLVAGCKYVIKIFDLVKGKIIQTFIAKQHSGDVNCLLFSQKEQIFFSGSDDKTIRVWSQSQSEQPEWKCIQALKGHQDWILCILLSKCESLLYSGSRDNTIKVWTRNYEKKTFSCCQTLSAHTDAVLGLSLNEKETFLASCSYDKTLIFWNIKENLQYQKGQVIQNQNYGNRLLFINDTQLLWQPNNNETPILFTLNEEKELFEETNHNIQQIQADDDYLFFPAVFISSKDIFLNVHNNYIYIIKQLNNEEFEILQIIEFEDYRKFGTISQDGEYLITWDYASSEIQIRRNVGTSRMQ